MPCFCHRYLAGALADLHLTDNLPTATPLQYLFAKLSALLEKIKQFRTMPGTTLAEQNATQNVSKPVDPIDTLVPWINAVGSENNRHKCARALRSRRARS